MDDEQVREDVVVWVLPVDPDDESVPYEPVMSLDEQLGWISRTLFDTPEHMVGVNGEHYALLPISFVHQIARIIAAGASHIRQLEEDIELALMQEG